MAHKFTAETETMWRHLGVTLVELKRISALPDRGEAKRVFAALKASAKKKFRELAFEWHPDRTEGDKDKERLFQALAPAYEHLEALELRDRPVLPRRAIITPGPEPADPVTEPRVVPRPFTATFTNAGLDDEMTARWKRFMDLVTAGHVRMPDPARIEYMPMEDLFPWNNKTRPPGR